MAVSNAVAPLSTSPQPIRRSVARLLLAFGVMPLFLLGAAIAMGYARLTEDRMQLSLRSQSSAVTQVVDDFLHEHLRAVALTAQAPTLRFNAAPESFQSWLDALHENYPTLSALAGASSNGTLIAMSPREGSSAWREYWQSPNAKNHKYFQAALATREPVLSDVLPGRDPHQGDQVAVIAPVLDERGGVRTVIAAFLNLDVLAARLNAVQLAPRAAVVLDPSGRVAYASRSLGLARGVLAIDRPIVAPLLANGPHQYLDATNNLGDDFLGLRSIGADNWSVIVYLPRAQILDTVLQGTTVAGGVIVVVLIALLFVIPRAVRFVARPIWRLAREIAAFTPNDSGQRLSDPRGFPIELQTIAVNFRALADRLHASFTELNIALDEQRVLREQLAETLIEREHEIDRRTGELRTAIAALRDQTLTDGLTGLANYRAYREQLETLWIQAREKGQALGAIVLDIDYFKRYNDNYGHLAGDRCLESVAKAFAASVVTHAAIAARSGGEEFLALFPDASRRVLRELAEATRLRVRELAIPHADSELGIVTVSIGTAALVPQDSLQPDALIRAGDLALYRAKRGGRDRIVEFAPAALQELRRRRSGPD